MSGYHDFVTWQYSQRCRIVSGGVVAHGATFAEAFTSLVDDHRGVDGDTRTLTGWDVAETREGAIACPKPLKNSEAGSEPADGHQK